MRLIQVARSLLVAWGSALLMCQSPQPHHLHLHFFRSVCFSSSLINGEALHLTGLYLIWFGLTIFSSCPILPCVKMAAAHHPIIQKEVDELLAKGVIKPSSGGTGFYSSVFVVPVHTAGLWPILNQKHFNHFKHIPSFKMPTLRHIQQLIQGGHCAFSIDLQDAYLHIPIVKHNYSLPFVWHNVPYQWKVLSFGLATAPWVFTALTKPVCSFAIARISVLLYIWMTSWSWFTLSRQAR